ncbi:MAG: DUF1501 domain-containing protein [Opitutales bacterium]
MLPLTRREFLRHGTRGIGLLTFSQVVPGFLTRAAAQGTPLPEKDRRILVLVQLAGGNDGLNTVVPFSDDRYYNLRPTLALQGDGLHRLNYDLALHPACGPLAELWKEGRMSIVQNVGYPNPNRSHFRSTEIWESASSANEDVAEGWIGRYFDHACSGAPEGSDPAGIHASSDLPPTFIGEEVHPVFGLGARGRGQDRRSRALLQELATLDTSANHEDFLRHTMMDTLVTEDRIQTLLRKDKPEARYPGNGFARSLQNIAALIAAGLETRVYFARLGGFDTHARQLTRHNALMRTLSQGLAAFQRDLTARGLADQVLTMTFSEFGRRPSENSSEGTDHGTAAPLFVMGSQLQANLCGEAPDLALGENEDLRFSTDFRSVYATVLERWLAAPANPIIGDFPQLEFLRGSLGRP